MLTTKLLEEQIAALRTHLAVVRLSDRNKALAAKLRSEGYIPLSIAKGIKLYDQKMKT